MNPPPYLSWSQYYLYCKDPEEYFCVYMAQPKMKTPATAPMVLGGIFSEAFENRKFDYRAAIAAAEHFVADGYVEEPDLLGKVTRITKYKKKIGLPARHGDAIEKALAVIPDIGKNNCEVTFRVKNPGMDLLGKYDGYLKEAVHGIENKFAQKPWTQERADTEEQITFYDLVHYMEKGVPMKQITLNWVNSLTGEVQSFKTKRTVAQLKEFKKHVDYVIQCIQAGKWNV